MRNEELKLRLKAERHVLGAMLLDNTCVPEVMDKLCMDNFCDELNRCVYGAIQVLFRAGKPIDTVTVLEILLAGGGHDRRKLLDQLVAIVEETVTSSQVITSVAALEKIVDERRECSDE